MFIKAPFLRCFFVGFFQVLPGNPFLEALPPGFYSKLQSMVYLERILLPQLWKAAIIVMDNLPVHHAKTVETLINSFGVNVKFLPAYSPDLSPIKLSGVKNQRDYAFALLPDVQRLLIPRSQKQSMGLQMKMLSTGFIIVVYF